MAKQPKGVRLGGRAKGTPNKVTANLREAILAAANAAHPEGIVGYLTKQAQETPTAFLPLLGKALPLQVAGDPNQPLVTRIIIEAAPDADENPASP